MAELEALSGKKRRARLESIRSACQAYIAGPLTNQFTQVAAAVIPQGRFRLELDPDDQDGQSLLFWYPAVTPAADSYIRSAVKIESGAKSALDPHIAASVVPYVAQDLPGLDLAVGNVTTVKPEHTFWDKVIILHGLRQWHDRRGELRHGGQRVSRHYYDVHCRSVSVGVDQYQDALALQRGRLQLSSWLVSHTDDEADCPMCGSHTDSAKRKLAVLSERLREVEVEAGVDKEVPAAFDRAAARDRGGRTGDGAAALGPDPQAGLAGRSDEARQRQFTAQRAERFVGNLESALDLHRRLGSDSELVDEVVRLKELVRQLEAECASRMSKHASVGPSMPSATTRAGSCRTSMLRARTIQSPWRSTT